MSPSYLLPPKLSRKFGCVGIRREKWKAEKLWIDFDGDLATTCSGFQIVGAESNVQANCHPGYTLNNHLRRRLVNWIAVQEWYMPEARISQQQDAKSNPEGIASYKPRAYPPQIPKAFSTTRAPHV